MDPPQVEIDEPAAWIEAIERILSAQRRRVLVLGSGDVGKSTFARLILRAARASRRTALLDLDVGQKIVGPPACVTLGIAGRDGEPELAGLAFVGATDPVRGWRGILNGATRLIGQARADLIIANSGGLLAGPGGRLKASKIQVLAPDLLVGIGDDPALEAVLRAHPAVPSLRLAPSVRATRKTDGERRAARRERFQAYFARAEQQIAPMALFFTGDAAAAPQTAFEATDEDTPEIGMLIGLADGLGQDLGLGLVTAIDAEAGTVTYRSPPVSGHVARLRGSGLVLDEGFRERRLPGARARTS